MGSTSPFQSISPPSSPASGDDTKAKATDTLASLLNHIDDLSDACGVERKPPPGENKLIQARLGLASSLFAALRAKHPPTALHCLRVAIGCSSWGSAIGLTPEQLDEVEVAALLHDIGKISVPDKVLLKPNKLNGEEYALMGRHVEWGIDILGFCCASKEVVEIVRYAPAWFDGSRYGFERAGENLPIGARMLAIVDAYDAMTTDQIYRKAMPRDRALTELFEFSGTQFDPELIRLFAELSSSNQVKMNASVARRWLNELSPEKSNGAWRLSTPPNVRSPIEGESLFHQQLLDSMHDSVVFVDPSMRILRWNQSAERLTGIKASSVPATKVHSEFARHARRGGGTKSMTKHVPLLPALRSGSNACSAFRSEVKIKNESRSICIWHR